MPFLLFYELCLFSHIFASRGLFCACAFWRLAKFHQIYLNFASLGVKFVFKFAVFGIALCVNARVWSR